MMAVGRLYAAATSALAVAVALAACSSSPVDDASSTSSEPAGTAEPQTSAPESGCADVIDVEVSESPDGLYIFDVTVRSSDTGWEKYADAWEVRAPTGAVLGNRELAHPHVGEQPFTRSLSGVAIPTEVDRVVVAARDSEAGFCGRTLEVSINGR